MELVEGDYIPRKGRESLEYGVMILKLYYAMESPRGLSKTQVIGPHLQNFWDSRPGMGPKNFHF